MGRLIACTYRTYKVVCMPESQVTAILDAGARSAASGQMEPVANRTWQIG